MFEHIIKFLIILHRPGINRRIFSLLYTFVCFLKRAPWAILWRMEIPDLM